MSRIVCLAVVMSVLAAPAFAGMNEGVAAVTVGDYPRAIAEFEPLAASGEPAAQYQLAKILLEGHGPVGSVPRGIELMTQAANGNYPEAQAQLGLMYAMGLGVPVDNPKAYDWLNKAVGALPDGTRRTVAESNRDAVLKRMTEQERSTIAGLPPMPSDTTAPTEDVATMPAEPAATEMPAAQPAETPEPAKIAEPAKTPEPVKAAEPTKTAEPVKVPEPVPAAPTPESEPTNAATTEPVEAAPPKTIQAETTPAKPAPAPTVAAAAPAKTLPAPPPPDPEITDAPAAAAEEPATKTPTPETPSTETVASAAPAVTAIGPASAHDVQSSVRIQVASLPTEEMAWAEWKRISGEFADQVKGLTAIVQPADLGTKGTFYRLQTGPFQDADAAKQRCGTMQQAGLDCLVIGAP